MCGVRHSSAIAWAAVLASLAFPRPASAGAITGCPEAAAPFETVEAVSARDGTTLRLRDGRELRLAGVTAANGLDGDDAAAATAVDALNRLAAGKRLTLHGRQGVRDRYGRVVAQVTLAENEARWIQADLVAAGILRVAPEASETGCAAPLLAAEADARAGGKGLWGEARFSPQPADQIAALSSQAGRFAVVEGIVRRVGETSSRTYLDFGRRYNEDFSIIIPRAARAGFAAAGIDLRELRGKRVRVRGVLFSSGGPAIEIRNPASLEILKDGA